MPVKTKPAATPAKSRGLVARLQALLGADNLITGAAVAAFATDVYRARETPLAVARPTTVEALQAVVRETVTAGVAVVPRGGGASYTDGYLPTTAQSILIDTGALDRIVEINETDAYVTVEAGVTWAALKTALDPRGLRTPFFGPFSGLAATVGGSMSQNAISHGSGAHGSSAESAVSLDVVIANGDLIRTGSAARGAQPFARWYGPDLCGLFLGDCGALGVKARITLPLLRSKPAFQAGSFAFPDLPSLARAMRAAGLEGLDDEHFAIDAPLAQGQIARQDKAAVVQMALSVLRTSPSLVSGAKQLLKMALAGDRALRRAEYMVHYILEGTDDREAKAKLARLRSLMTQEGVEIPNTMPTIVRGMPFAPLFNVLGPKGERWAPMHGILAHSKVAPFHAALEALYASHADEMTQRGVWRGGMFEVLRPSGFLYEVALYWPGKRSAYHESVLPADYLAGLAVFDDEDGTFEFVHALKAQIIELYSQFGATHFQLGKLFPYANVLEQPALDLVRAIKAAVDPKGLMNPGALGL
jgi:FAD/FMN-containing dehydrogenase